MNAVPQSHEHGTLLSEVLLRPRPLCASGMTPLPQHALCFLHHKFRWFMDAMVCDPRGSCKTWICVRLSQEKQDLLWGSTHFWRVILFCMSHCTCFVRRHPYSPSKWNFHIMLLKGKLRMDVFLCQNWFSIATNLQNLVQRLKLVLVLLGFTKPEVTRLLLHTATWWLTGNIVPKQFRKALHWLSLDFGLACGVQISRLKMFYETLS